MDKKRKNLLNKIGAWALVVIFIGLLVVIFFRYIYHKNCEDVNCFKERFQNCERTRYVSEGKALYRYYIIGQRDNLCKVEITLLGGEFEEVDLAILQGKSMDCYLPIGSMGMPDENMAKCHGLLKEGLQDIIIKKLNFYIAENINKINYGIYQSLANRTI